MPQLSTYGSTEDGYITTLAINKTATTLIVGAPSSFAQDQDTYEWHGFFFFDTSSIGAGAIVSKVVLRYVVTAVVGGLDMRALRLKFYMGNDAGTTLETTDYKDVVIGGTLGYTEVKQPVVQTYTRTFLVASYPEVNLTGTTNIEIDAHWAGAITTDTHAVIGTQENATEANRPLLTVDYDYAGISNADLKNAELRNAKP